jgi:hypothetical protein
VTIVLSFIVVTIVIMAIGYDTTVIVVDFDVIQLRGYIITSAASNVYRMIEFL